MYVQAVERLSTSLENDIGRNRKPLGVTLMRKEPKIRNAMFTIWRLPNLSESSDGQPLATTVSDLLLWKQFPYHRLSTSHWLIAWTMRPEVVIGLIIFYWASKRPLKALVAALVARGQENPTQSDGIPNSASLTSKSGGGLSSSPFFRIAVALHNFALALYSGITVLYSWPIVVEHALKYGVYDTYCDPHKTLWHSGFGAWALLFYISKYYEFVDTWILILKGKEPSFLQVYHHTGIVFTMWGAVASQSAWLIFVVLLNSFIHTLMYTYFLLKTIYPTMEIRQAKYLTLAQITQFFIGITCSAGVLLLGESCDSASSRFSLLCLQVYGFGLIALFRAFAQRKYSAGASRKTKAT